MNEVENHKRNFFNTAIADVFRAIDAKAEIGAFILTFCLIDYLTWLEYGHENKMKEYFCKWIQEKLKPYHHSYSFLGDELYSIRCGLIHTYGPSKEIKKQIFLGYDLHAGISPYHLDKINSEVLHVSLYHLLCDSVFAAHNFFEALKQFGDLDKIDRAKQQISINGYKPPEKYLAMHRVLSVFDEEKVSIQHLKSKYATEILYRDLSINIYHGGLYNIG